MTELDFDELDKAVNNLMTNVDTSQRPEGLDDPEEKVVTLDDSAVSSASATSDATVQSTIPTASRPTPRPAATSSQALAVKRRGQFMDVIHPSSNMRTPARPASRTGVTIQPTKATPRAEETPAPASVVDMNAALASDVASLDMESTGNATPVEPSTPVVLPAEVSEHVAVEPKETPTEPPVEQELMSSTFTPAEHDNQADEDELEQALPKSELPTDVTETFDDPTPLTTPFLTDTKVEKRPLGANSDAETDAETGEEESSEIDSTSSDTTTSDPESSTPGTTPTTILPAELQHDVVTAEAADLANTSENLPTEESKESLATTRMSPLSPMTAAIPAGGSIAPQYHEQPSTGDQTNGSIFDTATYHQAIEPEMPVKKSSPVKWIIWVILLLVVGAAAGVAYFYFTR